MRAPPELLGDVLGLAGLVQAQEYAPFRVQVLGRVEVLGRVRQVLADFPHVRFPVPLQVAAPGRLGFHPGNARRYMTPPEKHASHAHGGTAQVRPQVPTRHFAAFEAVEPHDHGEQEIHHRPQNQSRDQRTRPHGNARLVVFLEGIGCIEP
ncbi:hypothetical protein D3C85_1045800 [compost metagenome]